jgi:arylsulfatase A-like enzyme
MIAAWPGTITPGVSDAMLSGYDVMPTVLALAGLSAELPPGLPGRSFADVLLGAGGLPEERPVVVYDEFGPTRMIRTRRWKYVHRYPYGPHELYDLASDPGERINLLEDRRVFEADEEDRKLRAAAMRAELERWFDRYSDPRRDGRLQAVTGRGQVERVGTPGVEAFHPLEAAKDPSSSFRA